MRTIGANHPPSTDGLTWPDVNNHVIRGALDTGDLTAPFHPAAEVGQPTPQSGFDFGLRYHQRTQRRRAGLCPEQLREFLPVDMEDGPTHRYSATPQITQGADPVQHLDTARLQAQRARGRRRTSCLVENPYRDTRGTQTTCQRQTGRSGTHHDHVDVHGHLNLC